MIIGRQVFAEEMSHPSPLIFACSLIFPWSSGLCQDRSLCHRYISLLPLKMLVWVLNPHGLQRRGSKLRHNTQQACSVECQLCRLTNSSSQTVGSVILSEAKDLSGD